MPMADVKKKAGRGRPRTGSVATHSDHYDVRITYPDGTRGNPRCLPLGTSYARAREIAKAMTERAAEQAATPLPVAEPAAETFAEWSERWCAEREARGLTSVGDDRGRLRKWICPVLGPKPIAGPTKFTKTDVEGLVEHLDARVRADDLSWKTAANVWGLVTKALSDACGSKVRALRVRDDNPAQGVRGPDRGVHKSKAWLYPGELTALLTRTAIPAPWRRMYLLAVYLYLRAGELRALEWPDVDLVRGILLVHRTEDEDGSVTATKGKRARRFSIEPALLPLLRAMHEKAGGVGRVIPYMPVEKHLAPMLRRDLEVAGVTRADLFASDATRKQLRFHDLRATGITWMAVRGDDPLQKIMSRVGLTAPSKRPRATSGRQSRCGKASAPPSRRCPPT